MKKDIHPQVHAVKATCSCGHVLMINSTIDHDITLDVCSNCHPFYTKQQKIIDSTGRVERFKKRYAMPSTAKKMEKAE